MSGVLLVEDLSTSTVLIKRSHTRTDDLNLTNIWDDVTPANNQAFWYTSSRQLQNADGPWGDYTFYSDGARNRTYKITDVGGTVTTNLFGYGGGSNRLLGVDVGATTIRAFTYTANGNIASDDRAGTLHAYTWNNANRLKTVTVASSLKGTYVYNALEQQVARTLTNMTPAGTIHSIHDRAGNLIAETDGFGNTVREYIWLEEDARIVDESGGRKTYVPLAVVDDVDTGSPKLYFVHGDHLNRPIKMTDGTKASVWDAVWLPYGGTHSISGTASNNARFPGQWFQLESDLHYNWHRSYDPSTGRYTKADPLGLVDGPSVYSYAANSPQMYVDPDGKFAVAIPLAGQGAAAAASAVAGILTGTVLGAWLYSDNAVENSTAPNSCPIPSAGPMQILENRRGRGGKQRISDTGLEPLSDKAINQGVKTKKGKERNRYVKEQKARTRRNAQKRKK